MWVVVSGWAQSALLNRPAAVLGKDIPAMGPTAPPSSLVLMTFDYMNNICIYFSSYPSVRSQKLFNIHVMFTKCLGGTFLVESVKVYESSGNFPLARGGW